MSEVNFMHVEGSDSFSKILNYSTENVIPAYKVCYIKYETKILIREFKQALAIISLIFQIIE